MAGVENNSQNMLADVETKHVFTEKSYLAPQKKYFRQRAHSNPLADHSFLYPIKPSEMNWHPFYPKYFHDNGESMDNKHLVDIVDIGCGYGGLSMALSPLFPESLILGMEIRVKVSAYVHQRILALRAENNGDQYENVAVIRTNAMKFLTNFCHKGQLKKMFFLFPDPHFKKSKNKWRIISHTLLSEYAYVMAIGGIVYTVTDVLELHEWMKSHFLEHPLFVQIQEEEYKEDPIFPLLYDSSEEGKKVTRNEGDKYLAIFRRIEDPLI